MASKGARLTRSARSASSPLSSPSPPPVKPKKRRAPSAASPAKSAKKPKIVLSLATPHPEPERWQEVYELIRVQREGIVAPVDTMGCERAGVVEGEVASERDMRFRKLISLLLSSQTKDEVTAAAIANLIRTLPNGLCLESVLLTPEEDLAACINKVGFWRRKAGYMKGVAQMLKDKFDGEVPKTVEELVSLPGVGPKMAFLCLQSAWKLNLGIGVDTHVHRITNRLGWHKPPTTDPEKTRLNLESWLPKELHPHINKMLVGFGQKICLPVGPKCGECAVGDQGLCPSRQDEKKRKKKVVVIKQETKLKLEPEEEKNGPQVKIEVE
ncbi:DNA glycosylase [Atractiella rhizophila]|nr:DNA glycosylase [Atractiella rhizophila]